MRNDYDDFDYDCDDGPSERAAQLAHRDLGRVSAICLDAGATVREICEDALLTDLDIRWLRGKGARKIWVYWESEELRAYARCDDGCDFADGSVLPDLIAVITWLSGGDQHALGRHGVLWAKWDQGDFEAES